MRARFLDPQPPVRLVEKGGKVYVFLCLDEEVFEEACDSGEAEAGTETVYEYAYHEFAEDADAIDVQDVRAHPEKYMTYAPEPDALEAKLEKMAEQIRALAESNKYTEDKIQAAVTQAVSQAITLTGGAQ